MRQTPQLDELSIPQPHEVPQDVIPLFGGEHQQRPRHLKIAYDIIMLALLVVDLLLIFADNILMSALSGYIAKWTGLEGLLMTYQHHHHEQLTLIGGIFTAFWVIELSIRWVLAIVNHTYHRWFFFPFVHWYETLGCFPALRALRLLRAGVIIKRLHDVGIQIIPKRWINSGKFYYGVVLEELSDRVILTATDNIREQLRHSNTHDKLIQDTINKNRDTFEAALLELLRDELSPRLQQAFMHQTGEQLSSDIGLAVERALIDTPEFRKYLKLIPIAGHLIENQITHIGKHIGENVTTAINAHLFSPQTLDALMVQIAKGVSSIDTDRTALQHLIFNIVEDSITAFEQQIKIQQWKHSVQLKTAVSEH
ncbi:hypothetical protein LU276_01445 [Moraxella haemolytica]|uniref:hypothetical protein n=1 Tax=Moraxella haemolytica TaxID=2904119 RepID=UPI0025432C00|nr:hypothetical protein [Moraxella sp. ZY171148]WII95539.1 hypothetical protein LU276_01445 [Moraxella sp. ZY171148]